MLYISFRTVADKVRFETWYKAQTNGKGIDSVILNLSRLSNIPLRDAAFMAMGIMGKTNV